ncbi:MAG: FAD-binding oxidoreductase [Sphingomicrobium sp.]
MGTIMTNPFAIIGAGIAGASLAYRLARAGREIVVVDDGRPGRATGWTPGGINPLHGPGFPDITAGFYRAAYRLHLEQKDAVRAASGIDFAWHPVDRLFLAKDERQAAVTRAFTEHYEALDGFWARWMEPAEIAKWDKRVGEQWVGGLLTGGNIRLDAERYRLALLDAAARAGARVVTGTVARVDSTAGRIGSIDWGDGSIAVDGLCMAAGFWAGTDVAGWEPGAVVPTSPVSGDLLLVRSADPLPLADISSGLTAIYRHDQDYFWIGGTARRDGPIGTTTDAIERELVAGAASLMPGWTNYNIVGRSSAARPTSTDNLPIVGRAPAFENGWIINGLGGKGILLSVWAADGIARMIEAGGDLPDFAPVAPGRTFG